MLLIEDFGNGKGKYKTELNTFYYGKITEQVKNPLTKEEEVMFKRYEASAKKRNKEFKLTKHNFQSLINRKCTYCFYKTGYSGIDRIDNKKGYTYENCVPCCKMCNRAKHIMHFVEFDAWLEHISENYKLHATPKIKENKTKYAFERIKKTFGYKVYKKMIEYSVQHQKLILQCGFICIIKGERIAQSDFSEYLRSIRKYRGDVKVIHRFRLFTLGESDKEGF